MSDTDASTGNSEAVSQNSIMKSSSELPLIFLSHHSADATLAAAFAKMVSAISSGMLKSFRSSDKQGAQGLEFGTQWFPTLLEKLHKCTDIVCLLTANSIDKPWVLFEAGVAKGKVDRPILGVAFGVPLSDANHGPFAQFQNCEGDHESLVKLMRQLMARVPSLEPDPDVLDSQVRKFLESIKDSLSSIKNAKSVRPSSPIEMQTESTSRIYEEMKLMFSELRMQISHLDAQVNYLGKHYKRAASLLRGGVLVNSRGETLKNYEDFRERDNEELKYRQDVESVNVEKFDTKHTFTDNTDNIVNSLDELRHALDRIDFGYTDFDTSRLINTTTILIKAGDFKTAHSLISVKEREFNNLKREILSRQTMDSQKFNISNASKEFSNVKNKIATYVEWSKRNL